LQFDAKYLTKLKRGNRKCHLSSEDKIWQKCPYPRGRISIRAKTTIYKHIYLQYGDEGRKTRETLLGSTMAVATSYNTTEEAKRRRNKRP